MMLRTTTLLGLVCVLVDTAQADDRVQPPWRSPHAQVQPVSLQEVTWRTGFWAERFATCRDRSVPAMWELMKGSKYKPFYQHFLIAAGELDGAHHGAAWNDGDFYKWMEAACGVMAITEDEHLAQTLELCVAAIGRAQRDDGYLHTPVLIRNRNGDATAQPFQDRAHFEMYNMGHLLTAACVHHRVTGKRNFLTIARKTADFLAATFAEPTPDLARNSVCPSHYMGIIELYRTTGEARYLELARKLFDMRNHVRGGGDDNQDRVPFEEQREASGHAVRANYLYAGAADLLLETGDPAIRRTLEAVWENVTKKKLYLTGGCGALYDGASPDGAAEQSTITRVHQAYGRNYQLPNTTAHSETCAAIGSVLWNWRMFLATADPRFVDVLEQTLYNAVLSGVSLDGTNYFYVNPLRNVKPLPVELRWSRTRVPFVTSFCCPPNVLRTIAQVNQYVYATQQDAVLVNLYAGSQLTSQLHGQPLRVVQETDYPWEGTVTIRVAACPQEAFALKLRIPGWASGAIIRVNATGVDVASEPSSFATLRRVWKPGDVVQLELPLPAVLMESHPQVEETRNHLAVQRGPIVYCLESPDLPSGVGVGEIELSAETAFTVEQNSTLLAGVTLLEAEVLRRPEGDWSRLYRPFQPATQQILKARFVPYFTWANRGESEMTVWLPRR